MCLWEAILYVVIHSPPSNYSAYFMEFGTTFHINPFQEHLFSALWISTPLSSWEFMGGWNKIGRPQVGFLLCGPQCSLVLPLGWEEHGCRPPASLLWRALSSWVTLPLNLFHWVGISQQRQRPLATGSACPFFRHLGRMGTCGLFLDYQHHALITLGACGITCAFVTLRPTPSTSGIPDRLLHLAFAALGGIPCNSYFFKTWTYLI